MSAVLSYRGGVFVDRRRARPTGADRGSSVAPSPGLEALEERLLLSASLPGDYVIEPVTAVADEVLADVAGNDVVHLEQTQYDNFFQPNVITFDFAVDDSAVNGVIDVTALSDLDNDAENVSYDIEGVVSGTLWDGVDDGLRPFTAAINLDNADLAAIAADGNLHIEFTPNANVDDFADVSEYATVGLTYEVPPTVIGLSPVTPELTGVYAGSAKGTLTSPTDSDAFKIDLEAGQSLRIEGVPDTGLAMTVEVLDPTDSVIYAAASSAAGDPILSQAFDIPTDGTYTIRVRSDGATQGYYAVNAFVNEAIEEESIGGASNDLNADAENIDGFFRDIGGGLQQAVVHGSATDYVAAGSLDLNTEIAESFEGGVLPTGWTTNIPAGGRIQFTGAYGTSDGSYAMLMDNTSYGYKTKEAIWTVDLPSNRQVGLSFDYAEWSDNTNNLPSSFTGTYNGDGVSISADGITWHTVFNAWNSTNGVWQNAQIDLTAAADAAGITLGPNTQIKFQQYDYYPLASDGRGYDNIKISTTGDVPIASPLPDYYELTLDADEYISITMTDPDDPGRAFWVTEPTGQLIPSSDISSTSGDAQLIDFKASTAGTYRIWVREGSDDYHLSVLRGGSLDIGDDNLLVSGAQRMDRTGAVVGAFNPLLVPKYYTLPVRAGDVLTFQTATPNDGASGLNTLDPQLVLYDPDQIIVTSDDNSAPDGRNALFTYTALKDGAYTLRVNPISGEGNYILTASGYTGSFNDNLQVTASSITDGVTLKTAPSYIDMTFDRALLPSSKDGSDLTVNGEPAAITVAISTPNTIRFNLPTDQIVQGLNTIELVGGSLRGLQGAVNDPYTLQFTLDSVPPTIIESSVHTGDILPAGDVTFTVRFSEPLDPTYTASGGNTRLNSTTVESAVTYNDSTNELTVSYSGLTEGGYWFYVDDYYSGSYLRDLAGNLLDGEVNPTTTVPSGNGTAGGDFVVNFYVEDGASEPITSTMTPIETEAGFAYETSFGKSSDFVGDEERFTIDLTDGQVFSFDVSADQADSGAANEVEIYDPTGSLMASTGAGGMVAVNNIVTTETGTYTLLVRATALGFPDFPGLFDGFTGRVLINAVAESENVGGPSNNDLASAQDISGNLFSLGDGVGQAVVLGALAGNAGELSESFESGSLGADWTTYSTTGGRIQVTSSYGAADGSYALLMDNPSGTSLNEAVWTVNLAGLTGADLSFAYAEWGDEDTSLASDFTGHANGDGVSISDDGVHWHTILNSPSTSTAWTDFSIDLAQAAANAGMTLGADFKIKFQQYDTNGLTTDGRGYDNIRITGQQPDDSSPDFYSVHLNAGDQLSAALYGSAPAEALELYTPAGERVTSGGGNWQDAVSAISGFVAPTDGDYALSITAVIGEYTLIATRNADFDPEPHSSSTVLPVGPAGKTVAAIEPGDETDTYSFSATAGDNLILWTTTPDFAPLTPGNALDTYLELTGPDGLLKVEGDGGGDGLNALLNFTADLTGTYTAKLRSATPLPGSAAQPGGYVLHVAGNTFAPSVLQVAGTSLIDGHIYNTLPTELTVNFTDIVRQDTLSASDLTVNGTPADSVTVVDQDTAIFGFASGIVQGVNTFAIADGSILGLAGQAIEAFSQTITADTIAPRVTGVSIAEGAVLAPGHVTLTFTFDEPLDEVYFNNYYASIAGSVGDPILDQYVYDADTRTLTLGFDAVNEGEYTVRLNDYGFRDPAGNYLDGETTGSPIPPGVSGDGEPGGDFVLTFDVDRIDPVDINPLRRIGPDGSLAYVSNNTGYLNQAYDNDTFNVFVQDGQKITAILSAEDTPSYLMYLDGPGGTVVQSKADQPLVLTYTHTGPAETIALRVFSDVLTTDYDLDVYLNVAFESQLSVLSEPTGDAYDLNDAWIGLTDQTAAATIFAVSEPRNTITSGDNVYYNNALYYYFYDMAAPTGDGTLTITAKADLGDADEYLSINGEGYIIESKLFATDGGENTPVTATFTIPQANLEAMAANGTIQFTVTESETVGNYGGSYLTLELNYPGMPDPAYDAYAVDLEAGQTLGAVVQGDASLYELDLIDGATGQVVAAGETDAIYDHTVLSAAAPSAGTYILRVYAPTVDDYQLSLRRGATFDFESNNSDTDNLLSLDDAGAALGRLQTPEDEKLFAIGRGKNPAVLYELDPDTLQPINETPIGDLGYIYGDGIAYDGVYAYTPSTRFTGYYVIDVEQGAIDHTVDMASYSTSSYDLGYYDGQLIRFSSSYTDPAIVFFDPQTGRITSELSIESQEYAYYYALAGAEPRGSIFVYSYLEISGMVSEIDVATGQVINSFAVTGTRADSMAYLDGKVFLYDLYQLSYITSYDADTGQPLGTVVPIDESGPAGYYMTYYAVGGDGLAPRTESDQYTLSLGAGDTVTLSTTTPFDDPAGLTGNSLDPAIRVYDPNGVEVAFDDNSAADGKNASLVFTAGQAGTYRVAVEAVSGMGEYLVDADVDEALPGDLDGDGYVGLNDLQLILDNWNQTVPPADVRADVNCDGYVGLDDLQRVLDNWNTGSVPAVAQATVVSAKEVVAPIVTSQLPQSASQQRQTTRRQQTRSQGSSSSGTIALDMAVLASLTQPEHRSALSADEQTPWSLLQAQETEGLGLWEQPA